ncbi:MAG: type II toxin-antitoxin system HicB family antitoxin [Chloroflexi bacterium]|nr:type II toxin-antitoxin system HicB family antitoxin [Chloroflexota bacterium]
MSRVFTVVVEKDPESGWLIGKVVELPGCYTQAPDRETLERNIREAIEAYLEVNQPEEPLPTYVETYQVTIAA